MDIDNALSVQEVAKYLAVSEKTVYRWLDTGKLHSQQIRGLHFIDRAEVEEIARSRQRSVVFPLEHDLARRLDMLSLLTHALESRLRETEQRLTELSQELHDLRIVSLSRLLDTPEPSSERQETGSPHSGEREGITTTRAPLRPPQSIINSTVPDGYVLVVHFNLTHNMKDTTIHRRLSEGSITATRGAWQYGKTIVRQILSPEQQYQYWQRLHTSPGFTPCPQCPHGE